MKIFVIGFNKTGTTSIHSLFCELGLQSYHGMYSDWVLDDPRFQQYDCFTDGEEHDFIGLDKKYPNSKFILTSRKLEDWLVSRVLHVHIRKSVGKTGWMRKVYEEEPVQAVKRWIQYRKPYHNKIYKYFEGQPNKLLSLNICDSDNQDIEVSRLLEFLNIHPELPIKFPHKRKTKIVADNLNSSLKRFLLRKPKPESDHKVRAMIKDVLNELAIPKSQWEDDGLQY